MPLPPLVYNQKKLLTANERELPVYKEFLPGVDVQPLFLDPHNGVWVLRLWFKPGVVLPTHYHTGSVHLWTLSGRWNYLEYPDQPMTAGSYLFEPGSSVHTLSVPADNTELTEMVFVVNGTNINFDADGNYLNTLDANSLILMIEQLIKERGLQPARYITPQHPQFTR